MYRLYDLPSGNGYKVRLLLKIPFIRIKLDILERETQTPEFLQKNLNGKVLLLQITPDKFIAESNTILYYILKGAVGRHRSILQRSLKSLNSENQS